MRGILFALALMAGVVAPAIGPSSAYADSPTTGLGIRLVDAPVATGDDPRARVYIIDHLKSGQVINRRVEIANNTNDTLQTAVYPAAATLAGGSFVGAAGRGSNDLSSWTSATPGTLHLKAHEKAFVMVKIQVPLRTEPGERYGVVWAQTSSKPGKGGVTQTSRVGIRVYLSVGTGEAPRSDFTILSMAPGRNPDRIPTVTAVVRNTGGRALDLSGSLSLSDGPAGLSGGPFPAKLGTTLAIGDMEPVLITLDDRLPAGPWPARLTLKSGVTSRTAQAILTFPSTVGQSPAVPVDHHFTVTWWMIMLAIAGALLLTLLILMVRLIRRSRTRVTGSAPTPEPPTP
jgi:hypothetical protein